MTSPSTLRVAVCGAGYWGKNHVRNFATLDRSVLTFVVDRDPKVRARMEKLYPEARVTAELDEALASAEVDAVVLASPAAEHAAQTVAALRAAKHVLVEKPLALTARDAETATSVARTSGRVAMVGHLLAYHPALVRLRTMIDQGDLGDVYYTHSQRVNLGRVRTDENALWSFGPHDLTMTFAVFRTMPESVSARGHSYLRPGTEDVVFVNLQFPGGQMAQIQLSWLDPHKERRLTVVGSRKMVVFDDAHPTEKLRIYDKGFDRPPEYQTYGQFLSIRDGDIHIPRVPLDEPLRIECEHFVSCCLDGTPPETPLEQGLDVVRVLEAAERSMKSGGTPVRLGAGTWRPPPPSTAQPAA